MPSSVQRETIEEAGAGSASTRLATIITPSRSTRALPLSLRERAGVRVPRLSTCFHTRLSEEGKGTENVDTE